MKQANFYPGPSRVYSNITEYIYEAYMDGIMSINHRSREFMDMMVETKSILHDKLQIPEDYEILFTSSATECWEILAQSLTVHKSQHFYNGAFGEKWADYASNLVSVVRVPFGLNDQLPVHEVLADADLIGVTQNETSNATQVPMSTMQQLRKQAEGKLIAVDVTSSLAGIRIDYTAADVWYGSVQKCFGLPAGMGIMLLSPQAVQAAEKIGENKHYNSLLRLVENARKNQTSYTPNVLNIFLLNRTQAVSRGIDYVSAKLAKRMEAYEELFDHTDGFSHLVENPEVRSETVLAIQAAAPDKIKAKALERGIVLGSGYGPWKSSTFRIANFPAIKTKEVEKLLSFFAKYY